MSVFGDKGSGFGKGFRIMSVYGVRFFSETGHLHCVGKPGWPVYREIFLVSENEMKFRTCSETAGSSSTRLIPAVLKAEY